MLLAPCSLLLAPQVGKAMSSNESAAYEIMTELDVDYVLVIFGGVIGYSGDDIYKFLWMVNRGMDDDDYLLGGSR